MNKVRVGVIGCGNICGQYFSMAPKFPILDMAACADLDQSKAKAAAEKYSIPKVLSVEEMLNDSSIELILNLTIPKAHVPVNQAILEKGKHTYVEKPLAITREEGQKTIKLAEQKKLTVGCAPDTFMGSGIQTARKLIDDGAIGKPVAFTAFMLSAGVEAWHPNPPFYYEVGGGPMFDMGPYYLTALFNLLGPIKRYNALANIGIPERTVTSEPLKGLKIKVETPTHITTNIQFESGTLGTLITSFETKFRTDDPKQPITIYGENGTLRVPDPNNFDGPVHLRKNGEEEWKEIPPMFHLGYGRAVGLADQAYAIRSGRKLRASGQQALAVLDIMAGSLESSATGKTLTPTVKYDRAAAMPAELPFGILDE
ncbi:MAG TPA: Gfo/Idh/MocA family oxidoreductase [Tepidisphaeraceae bacterium]|jgi:predicted dehydrogenase